MSQAKQKAFSFLETMVLAVMDKWPAMKGVDEQDVITQLELLKPAFVEWMMREPTWMGLIANELSMDENQVRDCYNKPLGFRDFCHDALWTHFCNVLLEANFESDVMDILIKHKFIKVEPPEHYQH